MLIFLRHYKNMSFTTMLDLLVEQYQNRNEWDYYRAMSDINPFNSIDHCKQFIEMYFRNGSKEMLIFEDELNCIEELGNHLFHTIVVFFLGILIKEKFNLDLDIINETPSNNMINSTSFRYVWFITALYHDYAYIYENKDVKYFATNTLNRRYYFRSNFYKKAKWNVRRVCPRFDQYYVNCFLKNQFPCQNDQGINCQIQCKGNIEFQNGIVVSKQRYSQTTKNRYFRYKMETFGKYDHGIIGGDLLFSRFYEIYLEKWKKAQSEDNSFCFFISDYRYFSCDQFKLFAYIGDCIASHNIWKCSNNEDDYYKFGLDNLIGNKFEKIRFKNNPVLFLLCLCDSIEPTKICNSIEDYRQSLSNIQISFQSNDKYSIEIKSQNKQYLDRLFNLEVWMDCKVDSYGTDIVRITLR